MNRRTPILSCLLAVALTLPALPSSSLAKGYSSGGHSYSSHSSSSHGSSFGGGGRSSGFSSTRSSGGSSSRSSGGSGKTFSSGSAKSYSSGSSWSDSNRKGYGGSSKSYSSDDGKFFSSKSSRNNSPSPARTDSARNAKSTSSGFDFDTAAARARKEQASKSQFTQYKQSQAPPPSTAPASAPRYDSSYRGQPPPVIASDYRPYRRIVYVPDAVTISTRPVRIYNVFSPYYSRPWITYSDPYSSFFWWWLLDRALDDRAWWAYNHRYDMDPMRYQALLATDQQLEARVAQLEAQQAPRDPNYVPPSLDRDLMYSDQYVNRAYGTRPTRAGTFAFWFFGVPLAAGFCAFFIWLIWFKRWQTAT